MGLFKEYYTLIKEHEDFRFKRKLSDEEKLGTISFKGIHIEWFGDPERMVVIEREQVKSMEGNIIYDEKLQSLVEQIRSADGLDKVELLTSYGLPETITLDDIIEQQRDGVYPAASIGDDELDKYISDPDFVYDEILSEGEFIDFVEKHQGSMSKGVSEEELLNHFQQLEMYEDYGGEDATSYFELFIDLEERLAEAIQNKEGDLGKNRIQLRDSHHRIMAAFEAGEEYVCVDIARHMMDEAVGKYHFVKDL